MITYTIAVYGDMLMATAVDGDDAMMASRLNNVRQSVDFDDADLRMISGLTLYKTHYDMTDAEDDGVTIFYKANGQGHLEDAEGAMEYWAAGKA